MSAKAKLDFLRKEIDERIEGAARRERYYRRRAIFVAIGSAALSSATTVLIAVGEALHQEPWSIAALVTSALVSFLAAYEASLRSRELWVKSNTTRMQLYALSSDIDYVCAAGELNEKEVDKYHLRYKRILEQANRTWESVRLKTDKNEK